MAEMTQDTPEQAQPEGQQADPQLVEQTRELVTQALTYIYGDSETFASMVDMLQKGDTSMSIARASVAIVTKLEKDTGQKIPDAALQRVGLEVIANLYDIAEKGGMVEGINEEMVGQTFAQAIDLFIKQNPGRIDEEALRQKVGGAAQPGQQPAPQQPMAQPAPQAGLLEEGM